MPSSILLSCFCFLLIYSFSTPSTAKILSNETDRLALLAIKSRLHDPLGVTSSWNNSAPLCQWTGVSCGRRHQRVTKLDLKNQSIGGNLSPFIGNLSFLRSIRLEQNNFHGEIPNEVGLLFRLEILILVNNSFSGTIPKNLSLCSNLIDFYAYRNNLQGDIPSQIGNLLKLEKLSVRDNHLTGQLPPSLGNLSALETLDVNTNNLGGTIPYSIGSLRSLVYFDLASNNLFGMVPPPIFNISSLTGLYLELNRFYGSLPDNIGYDLPKLKRLTTSGNNFTGPLPYSLSNASDIETIDFSENYFSGKVSIDFSRLKSFSYLNLNRNNLGTGKADDLHFLTSLINCTKLQNLDVHGNQLGGMLPKFIGNLSITMSILTVGGNQIYGSIPPGIGNLVNLQALDMQSNLLSGTIPHDIGKLKILQELILHGNSLRGSIPASLGNLTLLIHLWLSSNNLQGNIPPSLGNYQNLMALALYENKLTGILPQQIVGITTLSLLLDVSDNLLSGYFPSPLDNLKTLLELDINRNRFSGEIPSSLGSCTSLETLDMSDNLFNGSIPPSLSSLRSIQYLDLSSNNLFGQIPEFFENLTLLKYLNLSYNHFEGEVPTKGVFNNKTGISLAGNGKLCGGLVEMHLPSCPPKRLKKSKIPHLRVLIPVILSCVILSLTFFIIIFTRKRRSAQTTSSSLHMEELFPMVSYAELSRATNKFSSSNMIGQGSHGVVYKGILGENRTSVAVKVINLQQKGGSKSFIAECEALRNIRHRNLIRIVTICSSIDSNGADFKALVYEYMENGSLEEWIQDQHDASSLSLIQRLNVAIDVAFALEYLHHHCEPPIVHGDLKPCNILLDHDMVAHVGDFGLSKFLSDRPLTTAPETQSSSIGVRGTVGYVAPEYGMGNEVSMPGDVYSFGILLLEMFTGKRPTDSLFNDGITLHEFVKMALPERVTEIVEPPLLLEARTGNNSVETSTKRLRGDGRDRIGECLVGLLRIGVVCSMESPAERMEMSDVVAKLCAVRESFLGRRICI